MLCTPGYLNNECVEASSLSLTWKLCPPQCHWRMVFSWPSFILTPCCVSLRYLKNVCAEASPVSLTNRLFKTIFWVKLSHLLEAQSPRRLEQWICRGIPQCYLLESFVSKDTWAMNVPKLPQCHQWMAFSRPSSEQTIVSTWSSVSQDIWKKMNVQSSPLSLKMDFSRQSFILNWNSLSQETWAVKVQRLPQCHWQMALSRPTSE